jgi:hypothetical protein
MKERDSPEYLQACRIVMAAGSSWLPSGGPVLAGDATSLMAALSRGSDGRGAALANEMLLGGPEEAGFTGRVDSSIIQRCVVGN